jgi:hypothetical protein
LKAVGAGEGADILDVDSSEVAKGMAGRPKRLTMKWGDGAKEVYRGISREMDRIEDEEPEHGPLAKRVGEWRDHSDFG